MTTNHWGMSGNDRDDWLWWFGAWRSLVRCSCGALVYPDKKCPICSHDWASATLTLREPDGHLRRIPAAMMGAIDWADYVLLKLMHVEWIREAGHSQTLASIPQERRPSTRLILVILFWTLFERMIEQTFTVGLKALPPAVANDLLKRYSGIGNRIDRLYPLIFGKSLALDMRELGYERTYQHLMAVQRARNEFIHGHPEGITDALVEATVCRLHEVTQAWIAVHNKHVGMALKAVI